jgi:uncharacterized SAM-binding protein YcdF (DUF218 family)
MKKIFFLLVLVFIIVNLGNLIDLTAKPKISNILVVLGGKKDTRIKKGLDLYIQNFSSSSRIILPNKGYTKAVLIKNFLSDFIKRNKINESNMINLEGASNTMEELLKVKKYLKENRLNTVTFISHPTHSLRIKLLANIIADYEKDNIQINFVSADDTKVWNKQYYFLEWQSIKLVFLELIKIPYNLIKYTIFL